MRSSLEMLDCVSDERITSAYNSVGRKRIITYVLSAAAAAAVIFGIVFAVMNGLFRTDDKTAVLPSETDKITTKQTDCPTNAPVVTNEPAPTAETDSRTAFIIPKYEYGQEGYSSAGFDPMFDYNGRIYWKLGEFPQFSELMGEKVGTASSAYIRLISGNAEGSVFSVNGYEPEFMLCRRGYNGVLDVFVNDNDVAFYSGADLFENRLHISENLISVGYINYEVNDEHNLPALFELDNDTYSEAEDLFMEAIDEGEWIKRTYYYSQTNESVQIILTLKGGLTVKICVYDDGEAVTLCGYYENLFDGYAIKVDKEKLRPIMEAVKNREGVNLGAMWESEYFTLEECLKNESFGAYVPTVFPEGYTVERYHIFYDFDDDTGEITGTNMIEISYKRKDNSSHMAVELVPKEKLEEWNYHTPVELTDFKRSDIVYSHTGHDDYEFFVTAYSEDIGVWLHSVHYEENVNIDHTLDVIYEVIKSINN